MNKATRVVIVTELFRPDETSTAFVMSKIADYLAEDLKLIVVAGPEFYAKNSGKCKTVHGKIENLDIIRVWAPKLIKTNLIARIFRFIVVSIGLSWNLLKIAKTGDVILTVTNPAPLIVFLAAIRKFKRVNLVLLVHDVFPENAVAVGLVSGKSFIYKITKWVLNISYSVCDSIIVIGRDMAEVVPKKAGKCKQAIWLIENWAELDSVKPIARGRSKIKLWGFSKQIVIQYAGNIGHAQGVLEFVELIKGSRNRLIQYIFAGHGALVPALTESCQNNSHISFVGGFSRSDQSIVLGSCDIAVVLLKPGMYGLGVPSKVYNIMASGKPILYIGPFNSEVYRLISEFEIGWCFGWDEDEKVISLLNSLSKVDAEKWDSMGKRARLAAEIFYSESVQLKKFSRVINAFSGKVGF